MMTSGSFLVGVQLALLLTVRKYIYLNSIESTNSCTYVEFFTKSKASVCIWGFRLSVPGDIVPRFHSRTPSTSSEPRERATGDEQRNFGALNCEVRRVPTDWEKNCQEMPYTSVVVNAKAMVIRSSDTAILRSPTLCKPVHVKPNLEEQMM